MCVIPGPIFQEPIFQKTKKHFISFGIALSHYEEKCLSLTFELYAPGEKIKEGQHIYKNTVGLTSSLGFCLGPHRFKDLQNCKYIYKNIHKNRNLQKIVSLPKNNQLDRHVTNIPVGTILNCHRHLTNIHVLTNISVGQSCYKDALFLERNYRSTSTKWASFPCTKVS